MQYRVSGTIGDLVVDLVIEAPERNRSVSKKSVSGVTDEELAAQVDAAKRVLGDRLSHQAVMMIDLLANQNKSKSMALSRAYREVWAPLEHALNGRYSREQLEHGMGVALEKGMPVAYAKAVARRWSGDGESSVPSHNKRKYRVV